MYQKPGSVNSFGNQKLGITTVVYVCDTSTRDAKV